MWFLGNLFVHENYHTLQQMHASTKVNKVNALYIYDMYNIRCFTANPLSEVHNVAARLVSALIKALNDAEKLPKAVIIIPDWDLIRYINFVECNAEVIFEDLLDWIITNMKRAVQSKRDYLLKKRAGAVMDNDPQIIWVKMINWFGCTPHGTRGTEQLRLLAQKGKFNRVLEDLLAKEHNHFIMDVNVAVHEAKYFSANNELSGDGRVRYWEEIIEQIQLFDFKKLSLKPLRKDAVQHRFKQNSFDQHWNSRQHQHNSENFNTFRARGGTHRHNHSNWHHKNTTYPRRY